MKVYYAANRERKIAEAAAYAKANPEKMRAWKRAAARRNKAKHAAAFKLWREKNRERAREHVRSRRAKTPLIDPVLILARFEVFGNRCAYCHIAAPLEADHVIPLASGGKHIPANIRPACRTCNASKAARPLSQWLADPEKLTGAAAQLVKEAA